MHLTVNGHDTYCYTGGKPFNAAQPSVIFIHGVLNDHSVWILQTRYFAHHGWNVLAPDLPGHCKSAGAPAKSVEEATAFITALMDAASIERAALVGHSFGSLVALDVAARSPDRVTRLVMVATASPMAVSPALLAASRDEPLKAIDLVNTFSHSMLAPPPSALGPGTWLYGVSRALMRRVLRSNATHNLFYTGFFACNSYAGGRDAMLRVRCPTLFILGKHDQMTLPKAAQTLIESAAVGQTVLLTGGHQIMLEAPDAVLGALQSFLHPR
jgi:pimeloyl-ACP methyl ester carboxylesterase